MINIFKQQVREAIEAGRCVPEPIGCGKPANRFTDKVSEREYHITGMCQECQDKFYAQARAWEEEDDSAFDEPPF